MPKLSAIPKGASGGDGGEDVAAAGGARAKAAATP
jgi:hypothetical protein